MNYKIGLVSLGCPKNLIDSEIILGSLQNEGFELTAEHQLADAIIVNTCAFIGDAKEEAVMSILEAARYKEEGNLKTLIVTGCLAERYKEDILKEIPEVDVVVGTGSIGELPRIIRERSENRSRGQEFYANIPDSVNYLDLTRLITDDHAYAYLKIAEGCNNRCTYCIIPRLRGGYRSRTIESILKEARALAAQGKKELILVAQDVTYYGLDIYGRKSLVDLIKQLSQIKELIRIRLLYCYPELIDGKLIEEMRNNPKLCKYFDIPIQHISDRILKAMGRRGTGSYIKTLLADIRARIPGVALRTTLITGFPGETEEDFQALYEFVGESGFERLGVFAYSKEEGTPAYKMKGHLSKKIKEGRRDRIMALQQENVRKYNSSRIGEIYDTMVDGVADDGIFYMGRSYAETPDIDPVIYFTSPEPLEKGAMVPVKILCADGYDLVGEVEIAN
mgnify:CR=1 FL=1